MFAGRVFLKWKEEKQVAGEQIKVPTEIITDKIEDVGQEILGKTIEILPGSEQLKKELQTESQKISEKSVSESTTITIEKQTQEIIEILKQLPQEQLKQVKKQIFQDFCQQMLGE